MKFVKAFVLLSWGIECIETKKHITIFGSILTNTNATLKKKIYRINFNKLTQYIERINLPNKKEAVIIIIIIKYARVIK